MKWCEHCHTEYEEHIKKCHDCGNPLVDEKVYKQTHNDDQKDKIQHKVDEREFKLVYVAQSEIELNTVISLLNHQGIETRYQEKGMGEYLRIVSGYNYLGSDIYVEDALYDTAKDLIENLWEYNKDNNNDDSSNVYDEDYRKVQNKRRNIMKIVLLVIWILPSLIALSLKLILKL